MLVRRRKVRIQTARVKNFFQLNHISTHLGFQRTEIESEQVKDKFKVIVDYPSVSEYFSIR